MSTITTTTHTSSSSNFVELGDADELTQFLNDHQDGCVVCFSATWCGPCKASKPALRNKIAPQSPVAIGYVYEEDIDDFLQVFIEIKGFPTYVYFQNGQEMARVQGADLKGLEEMIHQQQQNETTAE